MLPIALAGDGIDPDPTMHRELRDQRLVFVQILQRFVEAAKPQERLASRHDRAQARNIARLVEEADEQLRRFLRLVPAHPEPAQPLARAVSRARVIPVPGPSVHGIDPLLGVEERRLVRELSRQQEVVRVEEHDVIAVRGSKACIA